MAASYYMKLYYEILDDRKMHKLSDRAWRRCLELFLYAGELNEGGVLPPHDDIAWRLRVDEVELLEDMETLAAVGILERYGNGWLVSKFADRQKPLEAKDRMRYMREKKPAPGIEATKEVVKHNGGNSGNNDDDIATRYDSSQNGVTTSVTKRNADKIRLDKDTDKSEITRTQDSERQRECRNAMLSVCYAVDSAKQATPDQQKWVIEAFSEIDRLFKPTPDEFQAFKAWWWADRPPTPKQVLNDWSKFKANPEPKRKERNYASNKPGIIGLQDQSYPTTTTPKLVFDPATGQTYAQ